KCTTCDTSGGLTQQRRTNVCKVCDVLDAPAEKLVEMLAPITKKVNGGEDLTNDEAMTLMAYGIRREQELLRVRIGLAMAVGLSAGVFGSAKELFRQLQTAEEPAQDQDQASADENADSQNTADVPEMSAAEFYNLLRDI